MRETIHSFGPNDALLGVLAQPIAAAPKEPPVAALILNAGIVHRIGPNRVHVRLARRLAAQGVPALRLDLPAIGDSGSIGVGQNPHEEALAAVRIACDYLSNAGIASHFVLFGICSGAGQSIRAAFDDLRVVGVVAVDPPAVFPTRLHRVIRPARKGLSLMRWKKLLTGGYKLTRRFLRTHHASVRHAAMAPETGALAAPELYRVARDVLSELSRRDVRMLVVFTGDRADTYSYRRQLFDAFPGLGLERTTTVRHHLGALHTFPRELDRERLEDDVLSWVASLPAVPVAAPAILQRVVQVVGASALSWIAASAPSPLFALL